MSLSTIAKLIMVAVTSLLGVALPSAAETQKPQAFHLYFPHLALADGEYVEYIRLTVACGHIQAIGAIPYDWGIELTSAVSAVEHLTASAGHGASRLPGLKAFDGAITLQNLENDCFDLTGTVSVSGGNADRKIKLKRPGLKLVGLP